MAFQPSPSTNQLASMFMGNPGALQQRIQKDTQAKPGVPPDLRQLLALQDITDMHNAVGTQAAMQQPLKPPTVAESLRQRAQQAMQAQATQAMQQQQAMQAMQQRQPGGPVPQGVPQPQAQARPQGIDQVPMEFGLAGGGIVAFNGEERSDVPAADEDLPAWAAALRATRLAKEAEARKASEAERARNMAMVNLQPEDMRPVMRNDPRLLGATPAAQTVVPVAAPAGLAQAAQALGGQPAAPRPAAPRPAAPQAAPQAATPAQQGLGALLEKSVREDLGRDRDVEAQKMVEKQRGLSGMSDYQKQMADMVTRREAAQTEAKESRTPEWIKALQAAGGAPVRGGLGMLLGQMGRGATTAREAYGAEDLKYAGELEALRKAAMDAQLKGNMELAKTYADQYKEVDSARRAAMTSGTSLENTRENVAQRKQTAADALAGRMQAAQYRNEDRATAATEKTDATHRDQAMRMAMAAATKEKALPANFSKYKDVTTEALAAQMFDSIYNALKTGKMSAAPGAGSPGGTPADVTALLQKYGGK